MKRYFSIWLGGLLACLLVGCGARPLMQLRVTEIASASVERFGVGFVEGVVRVEVDNRNRDRVIFDAMRFDLRLDGATVGTMRSRQSFVVEPGLHRVEIPFRFRFGLETVTTVMPKLVGLARGTISAREADLRVAGTLEFVAGRPLRERTVRFSRRVNAEQVRRSLEQMPMNFLMTD
ncbi:LEA type 2 family protein [uncultured Rikenella sp.]|uniref:LEA type 2 family protein n=1 Tax=uncultured Rikenella sp. TaxID=368003 RepID=UPI0026147EE8|nr:LEA type 2 family protein [uncultured Rikenella sp.]